MMPAGGVDHPVCDTVGKDSQAEWTSIDAGDRRRRLARLASVVLVLMVLLVVARLHGGSLASARSPAGFHGVTAEALLKGDFAVAPAPAELLVLADPYDPVQNGPVRGAGWHDYSLYGTSLYAPFGPAPAVLLHIPYKIVGLGYLNPRLATLLCVAAGFLAMCGALRIAVDRWGRRAPSWIEPALIVGFGLGSSLLWLVSIGRGYEESIACGFAAVAVAVWALARASVSRARVHLWFLLASASVGVAVASRPHLAISGVLLLVALVVSVRRRSADTRWATSVAALVVPVSLIGLLLAFFNFRRFGSPFEFGTHFQLAGINMRTYPVGRPSYLPANLFDYLVSGPRLESTSPFVYLMKNMFANDPSVHASEPVAGMFTLFPWIGLGLVACVASARSWIRGQKDLLVVVMTIGSVAGFSIVAVSAAFNAATMRYSVDFVPWFASVAALGLVWVAARSDVARGKRCALALLCGVALVWSVYCGLAIASIDCRGTGSC